MPYKLTRKMREILQDILVAINTDDVCKTAKIYSTIDSNVLNVRQWVPAWPKIATNSIHIGQIKLDNDEYKYISFAPEGAESQKHVDSVLDQIRTDKTKSKA